MPGQLLEKNLKDRDRICRKSLPTRARKISLRKRNDTTSSTFFIVPACRCGMTTDTFSMRAHEMGRGTILQIQSCHALVEFLSLLGGCQPRFGVRHHLDVSGYLDRLGRQTALLVAGNETHRNRRIRGPTLAPFISGTAGRFSFPSLAGLPWISLQDLRNTTSSVYIVPPFLPGVTAGNRQAPSASTPCGSVSVSCVGGEDSPLAASAALPGPGRQFHAHCDGEGVSNRRRSRR